MSKEKSSKSTPWRFPNKETIAQAMQRNGVNAHQLSKRVPCSPQAACNWRDGSEPMPVYVPLLAKALGVTL